jgi:hypothetical protein
MALWRRNLVTDPEVWAKVRELWLRGAESIEVQPNGGFKVTFWPRPESAQVEAPPDFAELAANAIQPEKGDQAKPNKSDGQHSLDDIQGYTEEDLYSSAD